jgi:hypothetical protein
MIDAIKDIPDTDIVCFVDGYDVLVNSKQDELLKKFLELNHNIILSSELNCYPGKYKSQMDKLKKFTTNYKYINSGGYIGYKNSIYKLLTWSNNYEKYYGSDQSYFIDYYLQNVKENILLDYNCKIFQCMCFVSWKEIDFRCGRMYNNILDEYPCFIHFSGSSYLTTNGKNGLHLFVEKIKESSNTSDIINISEYKPTRKKYFTKIKFNTYVYKLNLVHYYIDMSIFGN